MMTKDEERIALISDYVSKLDKNALVLFNDIKGSHGINISEMLTELGCNNLYIDGGTKGSDRLDYAERIENEKVTLVASYGTFSTGIDLKNVHYIVLAESFKSATLIGQSIGRGLRNYPGKDHVTVIDFVDGLYKHTEKQAAERLSLYNKQNYSVTTETLYL